MPRRRKTGSRTKSGRLSRAGQTPATDHGTIEVQGKRKTMVGDADPALAASALGVLLARGIFAVPDNPEIAIDRYNAGLRYRELRSAIFPPMWPAVPVGPRIDDMSRLKIEREFKRIVGSWCPLDEWYPGKPDPELRFTPGVLSREQIRSVERVAIYEWIPTWAFLHESKWLREDHVERDLLLAALDALAESRHRKRAA